MCIIFIIKMFKIQLGVGKYSIISKINYFYQLVMQVMIYDNITFALTHEKVLLTKSEKAKELVYYIPLL